MGGRTARAQKNSPEPRRVICGPCCGECSTAAAAGCWGTSRLDAGLADRSARDVGERGAGRSREVSGILDTSVESWSLPILNVMARRSPRSKVPFPGDFPIIDIKQRPGSFPAGAFATDEDVGQKLGGGHLLPRRYLGFC